MCRCEDDQAFVCDSFCDIITESSNCTRSEMVESDDTTCPCLVCPDEKGLFGVIFCKEISIFVISWFLLN